MESLSLETDRFFSILNTIFSTLDIDEILTKVVREIQLILNADRCTLYMVDWENNELYSKVIQTDNLVEIRLPLKKSSISGYSAITKKTLNIKDAYNESELHSIDRELCFDKRWDRDSGYRTRSVLTMPIPLKMEDEIIGVFQALNKEGGFSDSDIKTMERFSSLLNIALRNALLYRAIEEEKKLKEYILDDIEEGVCILDTKKRVISASKFLEVMSGMRYPIETMVGENFFELFPNFVNTSLEEKVNEVLLHGFKKIVLLEVLVVKIIPYLDEKGRVKKLVLFFIPLEKKTIPSIEDENLF
ncbi:MAG: GAF domain-containing protein [Nitrospirae bacterium]|nr:GAF domain-containing protein [Nitrospirota bacterium]